MYLRQLVTAGTVVLALSALPTVVQADAKNSACEGSLKYLEDTYKKDPATQTAFQLTLDGLQALPEGYSYNGGDTANPWSSAEDGEALMKDMVTFYRQVCGLLDDISGTNDNALDSIQYFAWLYNHNDAGKMMVEGIDPADPSKPLDTVSTFLIKFNQEYKAFMDSSASTRKVPDWVNDPRIEIEDYVKTDADEYDSWNAFFARNLKMDPLTGTYPSRPVTMPGRDYVIVSPTDCIMNPLVQVLESSTGALERRLIENPLQADTVLDVKGLPISIDQMLANTPEDLKAKFAGGTGLSCVLMPNTYHHFHSPVDGVIRHAEIVEAGTKYAFGTFGYNDWANWVPLSGDVGRPGTDFSQFQGFTRGVIIIEVRYKNLPREQRPEGMPGPDYLTGYVASIPVGLDTVGSVVFRDNVVKGAPVRKGVTEFGNFYYGGSLNIMLFSPIEGFEGRPAMVSPAVQTRMGNQIGILNTPYPPEKTPWTPD